MAKIHTSSPSSGSGNSTINDVMPAYTGRGARSEVSLTTGSGVSKSLVVNLNQTGKAEFVSFDAANYAATKAGGNITITGKSNSSTLSFSVVSGGNITIASITSYSAAGASTNNGVAITDDPGAAAEFAFSVTIAIPENTTIDTRSVSILATATGGQTAQTEIDQAAGDAYLTFADGTTDAKTITFPAEGGTISIGILSNTTWTVS
jgi:hypothetical protein